MRAGADLAAWLDDPAAQARATARSVEAIRAIRALPPLARFAAALAGMAAGDAVDDALDPLFDDTGWLKDTVRLMMRALADDPFALPPFPPILSGLHDGLLLHDDAHVALAVGTGALGPLAAHKAARGGGSVTFTGRRQRLRFIRSGGARLALFRLTGDRAEPAGDIPLHDGQQLAIDGRDAAWVIDRATGDIILLQATIRAGAAPLAIECDAATGTILARTTTDEGASRVQLLASLLGAMGRTDAIPRLAARLDEPDPWLRWHIMREIAALDPAAALPLLGRLAADPDPGVRDAAAATTRLLCPA